MDQEPSLLVEDTYRCVGDADKGVDLIPYPHYTDNRYIFLTSTDVLTILDPSAAVAEAYNETIANRSK